jgi:hypothetical protein
VSFVSPSWSPCGKRLALLCCTSNALEQYFGAADSTAPGRLPMLHVDDGMEGIAVRWSGSEQLLERPLVPGAAALPTTR